MEASAPTLPLICPCCCSVASQILKPTSWPRRHDMIEISKTRDWPRGQKRSTPEWSSSDDGPQWGPCKDQVQPPGCDMQQNRRCTAPIGCPRPSQACKLHGNEFVNSVCDVQQILSNGLPLAARWPHLLLALCFSQLSSMSLIQQQIVATLRKTRAMFEEYTSTNN
jgi:hypothetical protein